MTLSGSSLTENGRPALCLAEILQRKGYMSCLSDDSWTLAGSTHKSGNGSDDSASEDELSDQIHTLRRRMRDERRQLRELEEARSQSNTPQ